MRKAEDGAANEVERQAVLFGRKADAAGLIPPGAASGDLSAALQAQ